MLARIQRLETKLQVLEKQLERLTIAPSKIPKHPHYYGWDLETTGLGKTINIRIWDIAVVSGNKSKFQRYVNPGEHLSTGATKITGMRWSELKAYPTWNTIGDEFNQFIEEVGAVVLIGFNSKRYDSRILFFEQEHHTKHPLPESLQFLDLRDILPQFVQLRTKPRSLSRYYHHFFHKDIVSKHTAEADANATLDIFNALRERFGDERVLAAAHDHLETVAGVRKRCLRSSQSRVTVSNASDSSSVST
jgi:DNA polymerase III alpha subunit (gram-positive type)